MSVAVLWAYMDWSCPQIPPSHEEKSCGRTCTWTGLVPRAHPLTRRNLVGIHVHGLVLSPEPTLSPHPLKRINVPHGEQYPPISFVPLTLENEGLTMELSYPPGHLTKYCVYREARIYIHDIVNQCERKQ